VLWNLSLPLMNRFIKAETDIFHVQAMLPEDVSFPSDSLLMMPIKPTYFLYLNFALSLYSITVCNICIHCLQHIFFEHLFYLCKYQFVFKIRDGNTSASVLLNQLTGTTVPQYILSSTPSMFLVFTSDATNVLNGYSVTWDAKLSKFYFSTRNV